MAAKKEYQVIREHDGEKEVIATATNKREIEKWFNRYFRWVKAEARTRVERMNLGWFKAITIGEWAIEKTEYYITAETI